ncbi:putative NAD(P)/FAD-binding protein YdhS [Nitrosospira sp. Nsp2]|uniref:FAD/NAD(P)-binding protein n=1 Tax=Nitrosospira sp. Nsp2 TaxID=136548 RepID=UPI000D304E06|nr:FAD/NAD(P)-binding protein [Nitrosospira sp. Nsp2]PTR17406.1 putative NAD(P)/FAD-binding protein YdhS [Nitrosospira sp. Nsp2]
MSDNVSSPTKIITIIGAGFCGALTAVNILRRNPGATVRIVLVDRSTRPGRGLAYGTWDDNFLLNVPAGNMSALPDDPNHFVQFCQNIDPAFNSATFVSRRLYGDYLELTLQQAAEQSGGTPFEQVRGEAVSIRKRPEDDSYQIDLANGRSIRSHQVVLALGHFPPSTPAAISGLHESGVYIGNPWDSVVLERTNGEAPVAILGTGLTAFDVLFRLTISSSTRKVYLISRHGLFPQPHRFNPKPPAAAGFPSFLENLPVTVRAYFHALRLEIRKNAANGGDWRDTINLLRPHTPLIWQRFPVEERKKFLSRAVAYWDIHRHRLAPAAHLRLRNMLKSGQVEAVAGQIQGYEVKGGNVSIRIRERHTGQPKELDVSRLVNCTGPTCDISKVTLPLIAQLRDEGYLKQDPTRLGFEVNDEYQVVDRGGAPADNLFYIGPMLKAGLWEAIAVPELRVHARRLAEFLTSELSRK